jgi:hypothetical protein
MAVRHVTYAYIEPGGADPVCTARTLEGDGEAYLWTHVEGLLQRAGSGKSPPATFRSASAAERFEHLASGDEAQFLAAAQEIAKGVQDLMDERTKPGLLVAARVARDNGDELAIVAKLEVKERFGGVLKEIAEGTHELAVVRNHLTGAADLQKGALTPDPREDDSEVVVGDRLGDTADYFLRGLGIAQMTKPVHGATEFFKVVYEHAPEQAEPLARRLQETAATTVDQLLEQAGDLLPADEIEELRTAAREQERPIQHFDVRRVRSGKRVVRAGGITIQGSLDDMDVVHWDPTDGGRWQIIIETDHEPRETIEFT